MRDFDRVGVPDGVSVVRQHLLGAVVGAGVELGVLGLVVALGDDPTLYGRLVVRLQVHVVDPTLEHHGQGPGRAGVDETGAEPWKRKHSNLLKVCFWLISMTFKYKYEVAFLYLRGY